MQKTDNKTKDQLQQVLTSLQTHSPSTTTTNSEPEKTEVVFSQKEQDATRYLFMRMNGVYGKAKMLSLYDTHTALQQARRQYAKLIGKYDREQIDQAMEYIVKERQMGRYSWPSVDEVLGVLSDLFKKKALHKDHVQHQKLIGVDKQRALDARDKMMAEMRDLGLR